MKFVFHSDPSHGWLEVGLSDLAAVGLSVKDISPYSYRKRDRLFLEEDCDASKFLSAYKQRHGVAPILVDSYMGGDFPESRGLRPIY